MHHICVARVSTVAIVMLIMLIHTEPRRVLIGELELRLEAFAVTALRHCIGTRLLDAFSHVFAQVLRLALILATVLSLLHIAKVLSVEQEARVFLLLLHESHWRVAGLTHGCTFAVGRS